MVLHPKTLNTNNEGELIGISRLILQAVKNRKQELIDILSSEDPSEKLGYFLSLDRNLFLEVCKNKELPPTKVGWISGRLIGTGLNDIYCIAQLIKTGMISRDQGVGILLGNMKYGDSNFIFQIFNRYIQEEGPIDKTKRELLQKIKDSTKDNKRRDIPPRCKFYDLPGVKDYIGKLLDFFINEIVPHIKK